MHFAPFDFRSPLTPLVFSHYPSLALLIIWYIIFKTKKDFPLLIISLVLVALNFFVVRGIIAFVSLAQLESPLVFLDPSILLDSLSLVLGLWGIKYYVGGKMLTLRGETVLDSWSTVVEQGAGRDKWVLDTTEEFLKEATLPGILYEQKAVNTGMFGERRDFLVLHHQKLKEYHMYITARDLVVISM
jgi:hypothetical protein